MKTPEIASFECPVADCGTSLPPQDAAIGDPSEPCVELSPLTKRTEESSQLQILVVIDEFTRKCLVIDASRKLTSEDLWAPERSLREQGCA